MDWLEWLDRHPGEFLGIAAALITGAATLVLALVTLRLTKESERLAAITKLQGESSRAHDERSYRLTQLQIDLRYRAGYYEQLILIAISYLERLRALAVDLGIDCSELTNYPAAMTSTSVNQALLGIQLRLHASQQIRESFIEWGTKLDLELDKLNALVTRNNFTKIDRLAEPQLSEVATEFIRSYEKLNSEKELIVDAMANELHPTNGLRSETA